MRPVKIVRILGRLNIGGPAIHAVLLTEGLNDRQFHSILVTGTVGKSEGDMAYFAQQHGVHPLIVPELGREISWLEDIVALWKLYKILVRERPDIVHTHTAKAGTLGRIAAVLARVPIRIHTFHGHVFDGYFGRLKTKLFILIERILAVVTTRILAISQEQLLDLSIRYGIAPREKFRVVPLGFDLSPFLKGKALDERKGHSAGTEDIVIGLVGRLVHIKNPQMAVRAVESLAHDGSVAQRVRLIVAGDGELRVELQRQVRQAGLGDKIQFAGWLQNLPNLYASLDLLILTSLNEGTPVVLIEAMAAGLPFIATKVGGVSDLACGAEAVVYGSNGRPLFSVFANGVLVASGDDEGFAAALKFLCREPERRQRMGREGRRFVRELYSEERLLQDMQMLYRECLEKGLQRAFASSTGSKNTKKFKQQEGNA